MITCDPEREIIQWYTPVHGWECLNLRAAAAAAAMDDQTAVGARGEDGNENKHAKDILQRVFINLLKARFRGPDYEERFARWKPDTRALQRGDNIPRQGVEGEMPECFADPCSHGVSSSRRRWARLNH
ncbi:MAG: hypothetical protein M1826_004774 [Phylliscum demangeonii]|nr:MAG: hypothetical protein M1826_004774 [Phylliscum demangeonii]